MPAVGIRFVTTEQTTVGEGCIFACKLIHFNKARHAQSFSDRSPGRSRAHPDIEERSPSTCDSRSFVALQVNDYRAVLAIASRVVLEVICGRMHALRNPPVRPLRARTMAVCRTGRPQIGNDCQRSSAVYWWPYCCSW